MKKFIAGFFTGCVVTILGVLAVAYWWTSPMLDVSVKIPTSAELGNPFSMSIAAFNPHSESVVLDNVDIPNAFFESFDVISVDPMPPDDSPLEGFGTRTWYFNLEVPPTTTRTITFEVRPTVRGRHVIEFDVCNSTEDCTSVAKAIEIR